MFRILCVLCAFVVEAQTPFGALQYTDLQQLTIAPDGIRVLTYANKHLRFPPAPDWKQLRSELAPHLDRRLVVAFAERPTTLLYQFPAWHSHVRKGCEGVLYFGADTVSFDSQKGEDSRLWTYRDIESVASSGPNQLTLNVYERQGRAYGNRRAFEFQLKEPINEQVYNVLWRKVNTVSQGLEVLQPKTSPPPPSESPEARLSRLADEAVARILLVSSPHPPTPIPQPEAAEQFLAAVAYVESRGNPLALSSKGARGVYQFMPETARRYGLRVGAGHDERTDPLKARAAAARYLDDLFARFGDWKLALAAYNAGEGRVQNIIERTGIRDFTRMAWLRLLPEETRRYVPAVLAHQTPTKPEVSRVFALTARSSQ